MTEAQLAESVGVSVDTIRRARRAGQIGFIMLGKKPRYLPRHLTEYLEAREVRPCAANERITSAESVTTGSASVPTVRSGAALGSIPLLDRRAAHHSALTILSKPSSRSRSGSPSTSPKACNSRETCRSPRSSRATTRSTPAMSSEPASSEGTSD
ncbi:helix-turn-helix domain-containing protein [Roseomonas mucosa]|uniref:helix-turn-helix domain-containing protein n=1 Tax=Roseomonas mucosa TaxID=207340 RepID=UPI00384DC61F